MVVDLRKMRPYWLPLSLVAMVVMFPEAALASPGNIKKKAQPIIDLMVEASEPIAYGCFIWGFVKHMLGHKAAAKDMWKGATYGLVGIKLLPWFFDILNTVGQQ